MSAPSTIRFKVRELAPSEQARFAQVLDHWLRPDAAISASEDCPLLLGRGARSLRLVAECDGQIAAHVALHIQRMRTPIGLLRVGVVGAVATDPAQRGHGLASALITRLQQEARTLNLDVLVLWATQPGLYERAGFVRAGQEWLALLPLQELPDATTRIRPATEKDIAALMRLHDAEAVGTLRSVAHWEELLAIPAMTVLVHARSAGVPDAYAACGKGHDLQGCIHEWAGPPQALLALARRCCLLENRTEIVVMGAPFQQAALQEITKRGISVVHGALGMLQALNPNDLLARVGAKIDSDGSLRDNAARVITNEAMNATPAEVTLFGLNAQRGLLPLYLKGLDSM